VGEAASAAPAVAPELPRTPLARVHGPVRPLRVLLAEDEPEIRAAVCRMLERDGHTVEAVADGAALIERVSDPAAAVDVVLCDLMMPTRTGPQVEAWLQAHRPELAQRTGFLTGGAFTADGRALIERDAARVLHKPFSLGELRAFLGRLSAAG
jgi:CheY-like chemotaxis protein